VSAPVSGRERAAVALVLIASAVVARLLATGTGLHESAMAGAPAAVCWVAGLLLVHETARAFVSAEIGVWATVLVGGATFLYGSALIRPALPPLARFAAAAAIVVVFVRREPGGRRGTIALSAALALLAGWGAGVAATRVEASSADPGAVLDALFSSARGVLFWSPVLWAGVLGYLWLGPRERPRVRPLLLALCAVAGVLLVVAGLRGGNSDPDPFRARGFETALPLLAVGLAGSLAWLRDVALRRPGRVLALGGALLVLWNLLSIEQYRRRLLPADDTVAFPRMAETNARLLSEAVGTPFAWPANWLFAARHDVRADKYDLVAGKSLSNGGRAGSGVIAFGDDRVDPALLAEGWSGREPCGVGVCRRVLGRARLLAPLAGRIALAGVDVTVRAAGRGTLEVAVNGRPGEPVGLDEAWRERTVHVAAEAWRPGVNALVFQTSRGGEARIDRVVLEPAHPRGDAGSVE